MIHNYGEFTSGTLLQLNADTSVDLAFDRVCVFEAEWRCFGITCPQKIQVCCSKDVKMSESFTNDHRQEKKTHTHTEIDTQSKWENLNKSIHRHKNNKWSNFPENNERKKKTENRRC